MNNLEVLQLHISKPFEPLYPAAVLEWASKEARKDNESRPTAGLGLFHIAQILGQSHFELVSLVLALGATEPVPELVT